MTDERPLDEAQPVWDSPPLENAPANLPDSSAGTGTDSTEYALMPEPEDEAALIPGAVEPVETEAQAAVLPQQRVSLGQRIWRLVGLSRPGSAELEMRLADLNRAIAAHPDAAINYALRGELYLDAREYALAAADFERSLALAAAEAESADWGIIAQAVQDRALEGLRLTNFSTGL